MREVHEWENSASMAQLIDVMVELLLIKWSTWNLTPEQIQEVCKNHGLTIHFDPQNNDNPESFLLFSVLSQAIWTNSNIDNSTFDFLSGLITTDLDPIERKRILSEWIDSIADHLITVASIYGNKAMEIHALRKKSLWFEEDIRELFGKSWAGLENKDMIEDIKTNLEEVLSEWIDSIETQTTGIYSLIQLLKPYIIERFTKIDLNNYESVQKEYQSLRDDIILLYEFYDAVKDFTIYSAVGKSPHTPEYIAKKLSEVWPIMIKLLQRFGRKFFDNVSLNDEFSQKIVSEMMESTYVLTDEEKKEIITDAYGGEIPKGISFDYTKAVKSASIAVVIPWRYTWPETNNQKIPTAFKIKKPYVEENAEKNNQMFAMIVHILSQYKKNLVDDNQVWSRIDVLTNVAQFMLDYLKRTFAIEFDFEKEAYNTISSKEKVSEDIANVPRIRSDVSNNNVIAMERLDVNFLWAENDKDQINYEQMMINFVAFLMSSFDHWHLHGDLHARNFWQIRNGEKLGIFDWWQTLKIEKRDIMKFMQFALSLMLKRKHAIARYFTHFQDTKLAQDWTIFTKEQIIPLVENALKKHGQWKTLLSLRDINQVIQDIAIDIAIHYKQSIDSNLMILWMSMENIISSIQDIKSWKDWKEFTINWIGDLIGLLFSERWTLFKALKKYRSVKKK